MGHSASDRRSLSTTYQQVTELWDLIHQGIDSSNVLQFDHLVRVISMGDQYARDYYGEDSNEDFYRDWSGNVTGKQPRRPQAPAQAAYPPQPYLQPVAQQFEHDPRYGVNPHGTANFHTDPVGYDQRLAQYNQDHNQYGQHPQEFAQHPQGYGQHPRQHDQRQMGEGQYGQGYGQAPQPYALAPWEHVDRSSVRTPGYQQQAHLQVQAYPPHANPPGANFQDPTLVPHGHRPTQSQRQPVSPGATLLLNVAGYGAHPSVHEHRVPPIPDAAPAAPSSAPVLPPANNPPQAQAGRGSKGKGRQQGGNGGDDSGDSDDDDNDSARELSECAQLLLWKPMFISPADRISACAGLRGAGTDWEPWEDFSILYGVAGPSAPPHRLPAMLSKGNKNPTKNDKIPTVWTELSEEQFFGAQAPHKVCSRWWTLMEWFRLICEFDKFTSGDGDGDVDDNKQSISKKLRKPLKQTKHSSTAKTAEHLQLYHVVQWKKGGKDSCFNMINERLRGNPLIFKGEDERPGALSPKGSSTRDRYKSGSSSKRRAEDLDDDHQQERDEQDERMSTRSKSSRQSQSRGRGSTTHRSITNLGLAHSGRTQSHPSIRTTSRSSSNNLGLSQDTSMLLPVSTLTEALREGIAASEVRATENQALHERRLRSYEAEAEARGGLFAAAAHAARQKDISDRHKSERRALVEDVKALSSVEQENLTLQFSMIGQLLNDPDLGPEERAAYREQRARLAKKGVTLRSTLAELGCSSGRLQSLFDAPPTSEDDADDTTLIAGPST